MSFPSYPEYKDSGLEWLGEVPAHWHVRRLRYNATLNPSKSEVRGLPPDTPVTFLPMEAVGEDGSLDTSGRRALGEVIEGYTYVREDDVAYAKITPCFENGKAALVRETHAGIAFGTTELTVLRPAPETCIPEYLFRVISAEPFRTLGEASMYGAGGQKRVPDDFARDFTIAWPPVAEQRTIATFLDHETARIDALIEEQQRLIELLKEKRQAVISHAVTKGLDPDVPMKDSGVEWLGEVPAHWGVADLRRVLVGMEQGWSPECFNEPATPGSWGVLKAGAVNNGIYRESENKALPEELKPRPELEVQVGDVIMCRASGSPELIGSVAYVSDSRSHLMLSDKLFRLVVSDASIEARFLACLMGSEPLRRQIEMSINGAEGLANNLSQSAIKALKIVLPPTGEQQQIVRWLDKQLDELEELVGIADRGIELLTERRAALISAAVSGKIDVRDWQPPASDTESPRRTTSELPA